MASGVDGPAATPEDQEGPDMSPAHRSGDAQTENERSWLKFGRDIAVGWVVLVALMVGIGLSLVGFLADSSLIAWDERVPEDWEKARTSTWDTWSAWASGMGETITVIAIATVLGIALLLMRKWASTLLLASAMLVEVTAFVATTLFVSRDRPDVKQLDVSPPTSSFPSGHTAASFALYGSIALLVTLHTRSTALRILAWVLAVSAAVTVGVARIYRGMHHPTDVIGGLILGASCVLIAYVAVKAWDRLELLRETS